MHPSSRDRVPQFSRPVKSKALLDHFGHALRSTVANMYLAPIREGRAADPRAVHAAVVRALRERRDQARRGGWQETFEMADAILDTVTRYEEDALAYAAWHSNGRRCPRRSVGARRASGRRSTWPR